MFDEVVYVRGIRRLKDEYYIFNGQIKWSNPLQLFRKGDVVEVEKFFLGIKYSRKEYWVEESSKYIKLI